MLKAGLFCDSELSNCARLGIAETKQKGGNGGQFYHFVVMTSGV